ncbi:MAG: hypothetical protein QXJ74_03405 [Nitrososphaera sp.]|nr:hypothetical protein [Nitrososphaera sp.]NWG37327.1 hypothetical protein [Nitrososphaera sp.]
MAAGAETVSDQDKLFYCDTCSMLFLSEGDARAHESLSGHSTVQPAVAQA